MEDPIPIRISGTGLKVTVTSRSAVLVGSASEPEVELVFGYDDTHPETGELLRDWVKTLPERHWDPARKLWRMGVAALPPGTLSRAGSR